MTKENISHLTRLITVCLLILFLVVVLSALRGIDHLFFRSIAATDKYSEALPDTVRQLDVLQRKRWLPGFRLHRYWWVGGAAVYVAEMDRSAANLQFDIELANTQIIGRETVYRCDSPAHEKKISSRSPVSTEVSVSEATPMGRGGMTFNLHIQDGELVSIPIVTR